MADTLQTLLAFPPEKKKQLSAKEYDKEIKNHLSALEKLPAPAWLKNVDKQNVLELIDPAVNSVAYLTALVKQIEANLQKDKKRLSELSELAYVFLDSFDPVQVRYAGDQWRNLLDWLMESALPGHVPALVNALLRLDPTAGTFTTLHLHLVQLCMSLGVPSQALPILDRDIYAYPQKYIKGVPEELPSEEHELSNGFITEKSGFTAKLDAQLVLEYYLLGAHIYIGRRNFSRARLFLEYVILSPTSQNTTSALQVEAYKKWLLVGLLSEGKAFPYPRTANQVVMKSLENLSKAYKALADDFEKRDHKKFRAEADAGMHIWNEDGNFTLVKAVLDALPTYRVIDLEKTFAALPVTRVATHLDMPPADTLQLLQQMLQDGHLNASLSTAGSDAVLRFNTITPSADSTQNDLEAQTARIHNLVGFVRDADRRLQLTKEFVDFQKRTKRTGGPDGDLADVMDLTWDPPMSANPLLEEDGEEDLMAS